MAQNSKGIHLSFPIAERAAIENRVQELKLPAQGGMSQYFQMLRDYDAHFKLEPHYHKADGKLHFWPEEETSLQAAEDAALGEISEAAATLLRNSGKEATGAKDKHPPARK